MLVENHQRPSFSTLNASRFAEQLYGIVASARELPSERDQNFYLRTDLGEEFVLKIASANEKRAVLEFQNRAMRHVSRHSHSVTCPRVLTTRSGESIATIQSDRSGEHMVRLVTYLPGKPLAKINPHTPQLLYKLGCFLGNVDLALQTFSDSATERSFYWDLKNAATVIESYKSQIDEPKKRAIVERVRHEFETIVLPELPNLRTSVIHNDGNDYNIIVDNQSGRGEETIGIIDFGDMVKSCTVFELAVGCAYTMLGKDSPVAAAASVVDGYHSVSPLSDLELELLFVLICTRLAMSVSISAHQQKNEPDNNYLKISEQSAWELLERLREVNPRFSNYVFRNACGLPPCPNSQKVITWLQDNHDQIGPVVPQDLRTAPSIVFDLSVGSLELSNLAELGDAETFAEALFSKMAAAKTDVGVGKYDEARLCYTTDQFKSDGNGWRTVHLGIDLFMETGTPVFAPLDGRIHSFQNNTAPLDYGPTMIIEHHMENGNLSFFTLYGHLSEDSLDGLSNGTPIKRGDKIGRIGDISVNGGWPPHLHFQLIADLLGRQGDFAGVAPPDEREVWLSLSPDPNVILGIPENRFPPVAPTKVDTLKFRSQRLGKSLSISYERPLKILRGHMQYLYDESGVRYLDAVNNVPHVGHSHPRVVKALQEQAAVLNTNTRYLHDNIVRYAERLCSTLPEPLSICFFVCSGSEANELALRLARTHTKGNDVIVVDGAYHGNTGSLVEISPYKFDGPGGSGAQPHVHKVIMPDAYRGPYKGNDPQAGAKYAKFVLDSIEDLRKTGRRFAAFICESLLGCGGQIVLPQNYLKEAYRYVREAGGVCIADEVQVGFGRVGSHFWGFETQGVVPDIVTLGKPIGNGHPLAAVVTTPAIAESFDNGMEYFNSCGGNPVSCAVGMAVLDVIEEEQLQANAFQVGNCLKAGLRKLIKKHSLIGDVRGLGLFLGVELVADRETLEPAAAQASYVVERMKDHGILISTDGPLHNVLKIKPPMVFSEENADFFVRTLDKILAEDFVTIN